MANAIIDKRRTSFRDIASHAGVAVSTVSRYLNGQMVLKPETEARVLKAMESLGYAQTSKRTTSSSTRLGTIGLIVPQIGHEYFSRIADSVVTSAEAQGFSVLIASTQSHSRKQLEYVDLLAEAASGIIYAGNYVSNLALTAVIEQGRPVVVIDEALTGLPPTDAVLVDDYTGAYQAVAHLASLGHERIALVTGPPALNSVQERKRGYTDALRKAGVDPDAQIQISGQFSEDFGVGVVSRLMAAKEPPTAVFAASDTIALGMMIGARNSGIAIPQDLSIVGFDDSPGAGYVSPRLTTVRTPVDKMAAMAVAALVDRIEDPKRPVQCAVTPVVLVIGESSSPPKKPNR